VQANALLNPKLQELTNQIHDGQLRQKVTDFLENPTFTVDDKTYTGPSLEESPGGLRIHHAYSGGYIEHVIATFKIAFSLCDVAEQVYSAKVNRDLVAAGVLLHDIFKPVTYTLNDKGGYGSAPLADFLDHISLAIAEMVRRNFPIELIHIVAAHYGSHGMVQPRTVEALIVHLADDTDSQLNGQVMRAAWFLTEKATGEGLMDMNSKEAFEIVQSKTAHGWKGVEETAQKIRQQRNAQK
jgi:7,8-dihydroneopterin 2',3'-cyclic phosphate phosphodiesterase